MAGHMEQSWAQSAHTVAHTLFDVEGLERIRALRRLTALPFWVYALAQVVGPPGDIGVAVARADGALLVPVVAGAAASLETCAEMVDDVVRRARGKATSATPPRRGRRR